MPMYYQMVEDTVNNMERLDIKNACKKMTTPHLVIHGSDDKVVDVDDAKNLNQWNSSSKLHIINHTGHTFDVAHPFQEEHLPEPAVDVLSQTISFLKK